MCKEMNRSSATTCDNEQPQVLHETYNLRFVWVVCLVAAMGGLLFGYDWVVIGSGADIFYERHFGLTTPGLTSWAKSSALVGCLLGALLSGVLSDKFGRKRLLILAGFLFTVSALGTALAPTFTLFIAARIVGGVGIGVASNLSPVYIAELSPARLRGRFVSLNQLTIVIGVLAAQAVNWLVAKDASAAWNEQFGWRWMFGAETVPALLFFACMFLIPESPRWLVKNDQEGPAQAVLSRVGGADYARRQLADIRQTLEHEVRQVHFGELLAPRMLKILALGVFLAVFQQWCGINVIFYYAKDVFAAAGYEVGDILLNIVYTGTVNLAFTFVAIGTVDRLGRRKLMLAGAAGLTVIYGLMGWAYHSNGQGVLVLLLVLAAVGCYAFSLAPITWVVLSEIFPNRIRGAAMSISVFFLWVACFGVSYSFPYLNASLNAAGTFWLYGAICLVALGVIAWRLPETKGKSLEQIERELVD